MCVRPATRLRNSPLRTRQPDRHYHTARHIDACLAQVQRYRSFAANPAEIEVALWFHDAIYDTRRSDNEQRSAEWASDFLSSTGAETAHVSRIHALIMATRHTAAADDPDQQLLVDIDLGILGQPRGVFDDYDAAIRREYHWVPWPQYAESRVAVLAEFLNRPFIYATAATARSLRNAGSAEHRARDRAGSNKPE